MATLTSTYVASNTFLQSKLWKTFVQQLFLWKIIYCCSFSLLNLRAPFISPKIMMAAVEVVGKIDCCGYLDFPGHTEEDGSMPPLLAAMTGFSLTSTTICQFVTWPKAMEHCIWGELSNDYSPGFKTQILAHVIKCGNSLLWHSVHQNSNTEHR